jgi:hypothetical protein
MNIEYTSLFACGFLKMMQRVEEDHGFNVFYAFLLMTIELHFHLIGDWLEQIYYKDLSETVKISLSLEAV